MGLTLTFSVPDARPPPALDDVQAYFDGLALYDVGNREAIYRNADTHTGFRFTWGDDAQPDGPRLAQTSRAGRLLDVRFELAYLRPRVWALEAATELTSFTSLFDLHVCARRQDARVAAPFDEVAFVHTWVHGNRRAYREHQQRGGTPLVTLPRAIREHHWRWNLQRGARAVSLGPDVAVPPIAYVHHDGRLQTAVMWDDAQNIALPEVDLILLTRQAIARRRYFLFRRPSAALVHADSLACLREYGQHVDDDVPYWLLRAPRPPRQVVAFFNAQPPFTAVPQGVAAESVHEAEEVEEALGPND